MLVRTMRKVRRFINGLFIPAKLPFTATRCGILFIHIPKAAGSSISIGLYNSQIGHKKASDYYLENPREYQKVDSFTVVREPIDRFLSTYRFLSNGGMTPGDKENYKKYIGKYSNVNDFALSLTPEFINSGKIIHLLPQYKFVYLDGVCLVNKIYHLENFSEEVFSNDFDHFLTIDRLNISESRDLSPLSEEAEQHIKNLYERDYYYFGYNLK
ncbi:sulfotransferase family 2 domain-containing protein [Vibrio cholerae]